MKDIVQEFVQLKEALREEKARLEQRLQEIETALAGEPAALTQAAPAAKRRPPAAKKKAAAKRPGRRGPRAGNKMTLKQAIYEVTKTQPLGRREILEEVQKIGYKFATKNPLNSINQIIYGSGEFENVGGKFRPKNPQG